MVGLAVGPNELTIAREFFELFKTPWEPAIPGSRYQVVISTIGHALGIDAGLVIAYGAEETDIDREAKVEVSGTTDGHVVDWKGRAFPLFRGAAVFDGVGPSMVRSGGRSLDYIAEVHGRRYWRVGYSLFEEVRYLLSDGQPSAFALTPTLDLHIELLRQLLVRSGITFVEVPPHPAGRSFICCLTHDLDFFGIRRHVLDRTFAGFVARASVGSLWDLIRGRRAFIEALQNWAVLLSVPLIFLRILPDCWRPLDDYMEADRPRPSTFFVVPFRDRPGVSPDGRVDSKRAVKYQASEVADQLAGAAARGCELAVHGVDAWRSEESGRAEMTQVAPLAGRETAGVRMHWLYFTKDSPGAVEAAGFDYDSTWGYNDAVGFRAGTSQVFRLQGSDRLMELPIMAMDTALFYRGRLGLSRDEALARCRALIAHARDAGGTVVVNWHDRSLAPERLWRRAYDELLDELERSAAWFASASDAVEWFRWRRACTFECHPDHSVTVRAGASRRGLPGGGVRIYRADSGVPEEHALEGGGVLRVGS